MIFKITQELLDNQHSSSAAAAPPSSNEGANSMTSNIAPRTRHRASTSTRWHSAFALCCYSNETRTPIANPPNSARLGGTPYDSPSYIRVRAVVMRECGDGQTDRHPDRHTQRRAWPVYIFRRLRLTRNIMSTQTPLKTSTSLRYATQVG